MYFVSRYELGRTLAEGASHLRGKEPILLPLRESALPVCISMAAELHAWIYPLLTEPIMIPGDDRIIGVINQDGELCHNPELSQFEIEELQMEYMSIIQDGSREAFSRLNRRLSDYGQFNKSALRGRTIVVVGDIVKDRLEIGAAKEFLKSIATQEIISMVGNIDIESSNALFLESASSTFLDVMQISFDDGHYFEQADSYSKSEQRALVTNIAQYWT